MNTTMPQIRSMMAGSTKFVDSAEKVLGVIKYIGIVVSVLGLAIIGIKYMISSVEGKAEYKKTTNNDSERHNSVEESNHQFVL